MTVSVEILVIGLLTGMIYAVLAAGLVLVYRATNVINFAHGEIGAFAAAVLAKLVLDLHWNFFLALLTAIAIGGAIGLAVELGVVRRLFRAPRLVLLVATIGVGQLVFAMQFFLPGVRNADARYPSPIDRSIEIGNFFLNSPHLMVIIFVPAIVGALGLFLSRTPYGIAIRATADSDDLAELAGISTRKVSTLVWVLAGMLAAFTVVLINPVRGTLVGQPSVALGSTLLLRALTAGLVGRLASLPLTLVGGLVVGVVEAFLIVNVKTQGAVEAVLFLAVLVLVLLRGSAISGVESGSWSLAPRQELVRPALRRIWWIRHLTVVASTAAVLVALLLPLLLDRSSQVFLVSRVFVFGLIALSVTVLTGWAGQLSLGQFALVGLGALTTAGFQARGMPFTVAVLWGTVAGVMAAVVVGFPALRVQGLFLAVTTLAFGIAASAWLFPQSIFLGENTSSSVDRGSLLGIDLRPQRSYYYLCLAALLLGMVAVARLRRSGVGRTIIAVRDNEPAAATFTISPVLARLTAFGLAGGLASLGGGLLAGLRMQIGASSFGAEQSLQIVAMTIIGGLGSVVGSVLGVVYVIGVPALLGDSLEVVILTSSVGLLLLLLFVPGGLIQAVYMVRGWLLTIAERRLAGAPVDPAPSSPHPVSVPRAPSDVQAPNSDRAVPALVARNLTVAFDGRVVLDDVSIEARPGEIVGLIGSNGAGKSTLMNAICGFVEPTAGDVMIHGRRVTDLQPHLRARLGASRVFQDARLFRDLTVRETVAVALESHQRSELVPALLGLEPSRRAERWKRRKAEEHIERFGLSDYADTFIADLSTGTRRIVEFVCLAARGAKLVLLDEPTAGVAQRETEAFGPLIKSLRDDLDATVVIIEHDIPLVLSICDRVYCLSAGKAIAEGTPESIRNDPAVIAAYLGTDERAIRRSGALAPRRSPRRSGRIAVSEPSA